MYLDVFISCAILFEWRRPSFHNPN